MTPEETVPGVPETPLESVPLASPGVAVNTDPASDSTTDDSSWVADMMGALGGEEPKPAEGNPPAQGSPLNGSAPAPVQQPQSKGTAPERQTFHGRDLTGLSEADARLFRSMGNDAYQALRPIYDEYPKLKGKVAELEKQYNEAKTLADDRINKGIFEHEEGYKLHPEYKEGEYAHNLADYEAKFWRTQLLNLTPGNTIQVLTAFDEKTGKHTIEEVAITEENRRQIELSLTESFNLAQHNRLNAKAKLDGVRNSFKGQYDEYAKGFDAINNQLFKQHEAKIKPVADSFLKRMPPTQRNKREVIALCNALGFIGMLLKDRQAGGNGTAAANLTQRTVQNNPRPGIAPNGNPNSQSGGGRMNSREAAAQEVEDYMRRQ
jgi:hypothetical protein